MQPLDIVVCDTANKPELKGKTSRSLLTDFCCCQLMHRLGASRSCPQSNEHHLVLIISLKVRFFRKLWCIDCKCAGYICKVRGSSKNPHRKATISPHRVIASIVNRSEGKGREKLCRMFGKFLIGSKGGHYLLLCAAQIFTNITNITF